MLMFFSNVGSWCFFFRCGRINDFFVLSPVFGGGVSIWARDQSRTCLRAYYFLLP